METVSKLSTPSVIIGASPLFRGTDERGAALGRQRRQFRRLGHPLRTTCKPIGHLVAKYLPYRGRSWLSAQRPITEAR